MKRSRSLLTNPISQLVLIAAIGLGAAAKADDGLPHNCAAWMDATAIVNFRMIGSDVTETAAMLVAVE